MAGPEQKDIDAFIAAATHWRLDDIRTMVAGQTPAYVEALFTGTYKGEGVEVKESVAHENFHAGFKGDKFQALYGVTALYAAAHQGSSRDLALLLPAGVNPSVFDAKNERSTADRNVFSEGDTVLGSLAYWGDLRVSQAKVLLDAGADPNAADAYGVPPLHVAAWQKTHGMALTLLEAGADPRVRLGEDVPWDVLKNKTPAEIAQHPDVGDSEGEAILTAAEAAWENRAGGLQNALKDEALDGSVEEVKAAILKGLENAEGVTPSKDVREILAPAAVAPEPEPEPDAATPSGRLADVFNGKADDGAFFAADRDKLAKAGATKAVAAIDKALAKGDAIMIQTERAAQRAEWLARLNVDGMTQAQAQTELATLFRSLNFATVAAREGVAQDWIETDGAAKRMGADGKGNVDAKQLADAQAKYTALVTTALTPAP